MKPGVVNWITLSLGLMLVLTRTWVLYVALFCVAAFILNTLPGAEELSIVTLLAYCALPFFAIVATPLAVRLDRHR